MDGSLTKSHKNAFLSFFLFTNDAKRNRKVILLFMIFLHENSVFSHIIYRVQKAASIGS